MTKSFIFLSFILAVLFYNPASSQKTFMGTITYDIIYDSNIEPAMKAQLPTEQVYYIKGGKVLQETKSSMGTQSSFIDSETGTGFALIDMMGQQIVIKMTKADIEKQQKEEPKVKIEMIDETKTIAGHKCKKAEITESDNTLTLYYATDMNCPDINWGSQYKEIKGPLLEYSISQQGISMKFTAKEVKETKVKDSKFSVPPGFKEMTPDELKKMFGGGE